jgi:hypothetical protein
MKCRKQLYETEDHTHEEVLFILANRISSSGGLKKPLGGGSPDLSAGLFFLGGDGHSILFGILCCSCFGVSHSESSALSITTSPSEYSQQHESSDNDGLCFDIIAS